MKGTREQAKALLDVLGARAESIGLTLKPEKTGVTHIDEGFVFLGQRFIRRPKGTKRHVYTLVCNEALASIRRKVKTLTGRSTRNIVLADLLRLLNPVLRGWAAYFRYAAAKRTASNVIYETPEGRPFWKRRPLQLLITLVMLILLMVVALALVLTGPVVTAVAGPLGVSHSAVSVWNIAKWPVLVIVVTAMFSVLFYGSPNAKLAGMKWVAPGVVLALGVWALASVAFAFYVAHFGSYDKTYGTLAGIIIFLVWLWISNVALLLGMEFNAERERSREVKDGIPGAIREIQLDPRSAPKRPKPMPS